MLYDDSYYGEQWVMYRTVESICCTSETNLISCVNYNYIVYIIIYLYIL